ncbi:adenylate cyclase [Marinobacter sp. EVN1]|uniref:CYTH domain-containing protein n=1 Tax=Marinobacter sp. EVN1 TaxID=1397532 RepID=UPI0003B85AFB|nr:CYTH domain-containing protein [Marinobacter sp. EVN1]ERS88662.1 adenylate cyclase [Marinobacter sp. EVN1]
MATELEVKLTLSESAQSRAFEWLKGRPGASEGPVKTLVNRYYDTPNAGLNQARAALRVRQAGDRYIQTLKTQGEFVNGAHRRQEWEWDLPGPDLDLGLLEQTPLRSQVDLDELALAFETNFQRRIIMLEQAESVIEVALDSGEVVGGTRARPLHEVEFELKAGEPAALLENARALAQAVPVFLNLVSKAEQGYYLAGIYRPSLVLPASGFSSVSFLHYVSQAWLTGDAMCLPASALAEIEPQVEAAGLLPVWRPVAKALEAGITVPTLVEQFPEFGQLQLALAAAG